MSGVRHTLDRCGRNSTAVEALNAVQTGAPISSKIIFQCRRSDSPAFIKHFLFYIFYYFSFERRPDATSIFNKIFKVFGSADLHK